MGVIMTDCAVLCIMGVIMTDCVVLCIMGVIMTDCAVQTVHHGCDNEGLCSTECVSWV